MQDAFQLLHGSMTEQAKALERLDLDMKVRKIPLYLVDEKGRHVEGPRRSGMSTKAPRSATKRSTRRSNKSRAPAGQAHPRKRGSSKARANSDHNIQAAGGYEIVLRNNKALIVTTDTYEQKSTAGGNDMDMPSTGMKRVERILEDMSDDHWERGKGNHLYESQRSLAPNSVEDSGSAEDSSSINTDASDDTIPILVNSDKQSRAFVEEGTNLSQCDRSDTKSMSFCISRIRMTETDQTFTVQQPCLQPCDHVAMMILDARFTARQLPDMIEIMFISGAVSSGEKREIKLAPSFTLQYYDRCPDRWTCSHTRLRADLLCHDGTNAARVVCLCSDILRAWTCGYGWELNSPTKSPRAAHDDDYSPLSLLQKVKRKDHPIPSRISFGVLVGYLKLIEGLHLEEEYLVQCHNWTDAILSEVSTSFNEQAIAWAWVLWKLQRGTEFKRLTAIIQQQGKHSIGQETNRYGVILPPQIISKYIVPLLTRVGEIISHKQSQGPSTRNVFQSFRRSEISCKTASKPVDVISW